MEAKAEAHVEAPPQGKGKNPKAERAKEKARELFKSTSGWSSGFWGR